MGAGQGDAAAALCSLLAQSTVLIITPKSWQVLAALDSARPDRDAELLVHHEGEDAHLGRAAVVELDGALGLLGVGGSTREGSLALAPAP